MRHPTEWEVSRPGTRTSAATHRNRPLRGAHGHAEQNHRVNQVVLRRGIPRLEQVRILDNLFEPVRPEGTQRDPGRAENSGRHQPIRRTHANSCERLTADG